MHVPESAHKEDNIDPRPVIRKLDSLGNKYYFTMQPKMSITVRNTKRTPGGMMDGRK